MAKEVKKKPAVKVEVPEGASKILFDISIKILGREDTINVSSLDKMSFLSIVNTIESGAQKRIKVRGGDGVISIRTSQITDFFTKEKKA